MAKKKPPAAKLPANWPSTQIEPRAIGKLLPYANNPRLHSEAQVAQLAEAIQEYGWTVPCLVDAKGEVIAGHGRILAAHKLGIKTVPVMVAKGWTEAQRRAYRIWDNQSTLLAAWDTKLLATELQALEQAHYPLGFTGFDETQLVQFMAGLNEIDPRAEEVPEPPKEPVSVLGDLWVLGEHRLLCGDATNADDVRHLMDGNKALLFATDPPYAVGYSGGSHPATKANRGKANRNKNWVDYKEAGLGDAETDSDVAAEEFYKNFIAVAVSTAIAQNAPWYCWHASKRQAMVERIWNAHDAFVHQQIIWVKTRAVLTYSQYMWQHEPCLFGWVKGNRPKVHRGKGTTLSTVWQVPNAEIESQEHPTSKPTKLFSIPIEQHTVVRNICYEPFSGSGTQIIAAEMLSRRCFALEISPVFVDVSLLRWQTYTGKEAVLESTGRSYEQTKIERADQRASIRAAQ